MMKKRLRTMSWVAALLCSWSMAGAVRASQHQAVMTRDTSYEEYLHISANPDEEKITPIRVIHWMMGMRGQDIMPHTSTEFQPVFDANQHHVRAVAAIAYKFF